MVLEFTATEKGSFLKTELPYLVSNPSFSLSFEERNTLSTWLSRRYRRAAFSNEFEQRIKMKRLDEKISKRLASMSDLIYGLYVEIPNEQQVELDPSSEPYELRIYVVWIDDGSVEAEEKVLQLVSGIESLFKKAFFDTSTNRWSLIELSECTDVSTGALSLDRVSRLRRWNAEYLSLRASPQQPLPQDGT